MRKDSPKTSEQVSTNRDLKMTVKLQAWVKASFLPTFPSVNTSPISPPSFAISPLFEYIFYPLSTAPIIIFTNVNLKGNS